MIIDCRKMTPVQSQYCMFSIIISCHFSHNEPNTRFVDNEAVLFLQGDFCAMIIQA
jgi:hypothetical protein